MRGEKEPAGHHEHEAAPCAAAEPLRQGMQEAERAGDQWPAAQSEHCLEASEAKEPAGQAAQAAPALEPK